MIKTIVAPSPSDSLLKAEITTMSSSTLHESLVSLTVGSSGQLPKAEDVRIALDSYLKLAVPGIQINSIDPTVSLAALNSISANVNFIYDGKRYDAFAKVHIESNRQKREVSSVAGVQEYQNAALLEKHGWPVITPLDIPLNEDFPILFYPRISSPTLFDLLSQSYRENRCLLTENHFANLKAFEKMVGESCVRSLKMVDRDMAIEESSSPVQSLFLSRMVNGGRLEQWYRSDTPFELPGAPYSLSWQEISHSNWKINGRNFDSTILELLEKARLRLSHSDETLAFACISHGDDHAGNIFLDDNLKVGQAFDPAFAGWNPAALAHVKAFMHSGVLPLAGLYYDPKLEACSYSYSEGKIEAILDFSRHPLLQTHCRIAKDIVDIRIIPLFKKMKELGADTLLEYERFKAAMLTCCLLVINVSGLLSKAKNIKNSSSGTGEGLLPLSILCSDMSVLPQLEYLDAEMKKII